MKVRIKSLPVANNGLKVENDNYEMLSPDTLLLKGEKHKNGGTKVQFGPTVVEAEAGETISIDESGNAVIMGNLTIPGSKKKFKEVAKEIGKEEAKYNKQLDKGIELVNNSNPYDGFEIFSFNSGKVLTDAALIKDREISQKKELLSQLQNRILETAEQTGKSPEKIVNSFEKGGTLQKYQEGGNIERLKGDIQRAAIINEIDPNILMTLVGVESGYDTQARSNKGALGAMQMMPATAKQYGIKESELRSTDPNVQQKVVMAAARHFKDLLKQNNNDYTLALAAYNGGQGAVNFVKEKTGKESITGEDWLSFMQDRRETAPTKKSSAWQNETFNYVNKIQGKPEESVFAPSINYIGENKLRPDLTSSEQLINIPSFAPDPNEVPDMQGLAQQTTRPIQPNELGVLGGSDETISTNTPRDYQPAEVKPITNRLGLQDFMGELAALTDRPDYVPGQSFEPQLYQPYQVSFQDRLNKNNSTFRAISQQLTNNPEALSVIAAQKYEADNNVLAEEFRTNQAISNQVTNQNTELLNQSQLQNLQLEDLQQQRQAQAKGITEDRKMQALSSISNKVNQNKALNNSLRMYENFSNFKMDESGQLLYAGPDPVSLIGMGDGSSASDPYKKTMTTRDAQGNVKNTREFSPSEIDKQIQFWNLQKQRRSGISS